MKRRDFFTKLLGAAVVAAVAPNVFRKEEKDWLAILKENGAEEWGARFDDIKPWPPDGAMYPIIKKPPAWSDIYEVYFDDYDIREILRIWKETGILLFRSI